MWNIQILKVALTILSRMTYRFPKDSVLHQQHLQSSSWSILPQKSIPLSLLQNISLLGFLLHSSSVQVPRSTGAACRAADRGAACAPSLPTCLARPASKPAPGLLLLGFHRLPQVRTWNFRQWQETGPACPDPLSDMGVWAVGPEPENKCLALGLLRRFHRGGGGGRNSGNRLEGLRNKPALCSGLGWGSRRVALGRPCRGSFFGPQKLWKGGDWTFNNSFYYWGENISSFVWSFFSECK